MSSPPKINLRPATLLDAPRLRAWETYPHLRATLGNDDWCWETELAVIPDWREPLIAELAGRAIGFMDIINPSREDGKYWGDGVSSKLRAIDLWIGEPDCLGRGHGTEMMRQGLARCFLDPAVEGVLVDPLGDNTRAHRFYQKLGFVPLERRRFGDDECLVHVLTRPIATAAA
jgi:aminoglycoside 6'-N-acetyltransferase